MGGQVAAPTSLRLARSRRPRRAVPARPHRVLGKRGPDQLRADEHRRLGGHSASGGSRSLSSGGRRVAGPHLGSGRRYQDVADVGGGSQLDLHARRAGARDARRSHERRAADARSRLSRSSHRAGLVRVQLHQVGRSHRSRRRRGAGDDADEGVRRANASADGTDASRRAGARARLHPRGDRHRRNACAGRAVACRRPHRIPHRRHRLGRVDADQRAVDPVQSRTSRGCVSTSARCRPARSRGACGRTCGARQRPADTRSCCEWTTRRSGPAGSISFSTCAKSSSTRSDHDERHERHETGQRSARNARKRSFGSSLSCLSC